MRLHQTVIANDFGHRGTPVAAPCHPYVRCESRDTQVPHRVSLSLHLGTGFEFVPTPSSARARKAKRARECAVDGQGSSREDRPMIVTFFGAAVVAMAFWGGKVCDDGF